MINLEKIRQVPWASYSIGKDPLSLIGSFQSGLTVDLIATKRAHFEICDLSESLLSVVERNRRTNFDFLPVLDSATHRIVGLLEIAPFTQEKVSDRPVAEIMRPLSEENLIGADAGILTFVREADHKKCRLIVSGCEISGLVSLSDLQRLPVRAALFGIVTYLEIIMAELIRREFEGGQGWLHRLTDDRQQKLKAEIDKAQRDDDFVEALLFTQLADKITIIRKSPRFAFGKGEFERDLKKIQALRDHLAHANDFASTARAASDTCKTVRLTDKWTDRLLEAFDATKG